MSQQYADLRDQLIDAHDQVVRQRQELIDLRDEQVRLLTELDQLERRTAERQVELVRMETEIGKMRATKIWRIGTLYWRAHAWAKSTLER